VGIICWQSVSGFLEPDDWRLFTASETGAGNMHQKPANVSSTLDQQLNHHTM